MFLGNWACVKCKINDQCMTFQSAVELVPMFSETFPANHFVALSDCIHSLYGKAAAHWIYSCSSRELSFTFNIYKLAHDFVIIPNVRTGWHIKISYQDIKVAQFCSKGSRAGGGGHRLNCASGNCCHWLPNASHGLVSGVIQITRFVPQNNSAKRRANNDLHWFGVTHCSRLF